MLTSGVVCRITLTFTPTLLGVQERTLTVKCDLGSSCIPLTGNGAPGILKFTPATVSFGKPTDGVTSPVSKMATITNGKPVGLRVTQTQANRQLSASERHLRVAECGSDLRDHSDCNANQPVESFSDVSGVATATGICKGSLSIARWKDVAVSGVSIRSLSKCPRSSTIPSREVVD
jgi:hypothetical protein